MKTIEELYRAWYASAQPLFAIQRRTSINLHVRHFREVEKEIENAYRAGFADCAAAIKEASDG